MPAARAAGIKELEIVVDGHERCPYRFSDREAALDVGGLLAVDALADAPELAPPPPFLAEIRSWARGQGYDVAERVRVSRQVLAAYEAATGERRPD